jgi:hypothetical protein
MRSNRLRATTYGALAGALAGLGLLVFWTGRVALSSIDGVLLTGVARGRSVFAVSSGGMYLLVVLSGIVGGLAIAGITYALGREAEPDSPRFPLGYLLPAAAAASAIMAYGVLRVGLAVSGDISEGVVTISVFRMAVVAVTAGAVAGAITARAVDALARPAFLGLEGEAWPSSPGLFARETVRALGGPIVATVTVAVLAIGLSQLLLALHGAAVVVVFSVAAALVLAGAAALAYLPREPAERR